MYMCGVFSVNINFILSNDYLIVFILFSIELHGKKNCFLTFFSLVNLIVKLY